MAYLKYYEDENQRLPHVDIPCTADEARQALKKLFKHFKLAPIIIEFTKGNRRSHFSGSKIRLNTDYLTWLLVCHEFAHYWHRSRQKEKISELRRSSLFAQQIQRAAIEKRIRTIANQHAHGKNHANLTDRVAKYVVSKNWHTGLIKTKIESKIQLKAETEKQLKEKLLSKDFKIQKRQEQIARLERKIKTLNTRLKTAKRSLSALQRTR